MKRAVVFLVLGVLAIWYMGSRPQREETTVGTATPAIPPPYIPPPAKPVWAMKVINQKWKAGGFGSVAIMDITIKNDNAYPVEDITVECTFYGNSGTAISENRKIIYDFIGAKATKTFSSINMGFINSQAARGGCNLLSAAQRNKPILSR